MCSLARMELMLTIGEVARRSGVATSALRFYEERGLIASERAGSGHRRYPRAVLRRVAFIVFAQRIGLTLEEIGAELAKLPHDRVPARRDWARLSGAWTARIDERIAELHRLRAGLTECIGCGCLSHRPLPPGEPRRPRRRRRPGPPLLARRARQAPAHAWGAAKSISPSAVFSRPCVSRRDGCGCGFGSCLVGLRRLFEELTAISLDQARKRFHVRPAFVVSGKTTLARWFAHREHRVLEIPGVKRNSIRDGPFRTV